MIEKLLNFLGYSKAKHLETVTGGTVIDPGTGFEYIAAGTTINGVFSDVSGQCINIRSNALAFSEWNIYRKRGDNEPELVDTNHWANLLFRDPESESINFTYYKTLCQWLDKDGNVYLRPWNPGFENREPNRLDILDSSRMQIIEFSETDYYYYYSDRFGNHYKFAPDEILHVKQYYPGTSAEPKGIGLSTIALAAILQNRKISEYISAFVTNNNQADVYLKPIVETMNTISNESYEKAQQLGKSINTNARMPNVAGVMPSGFEMENISDNNISNSTIDIIKLQELVQNTVANTFGIPMPLITGLSQNYATADITRLNAIDTAIKPILSQFEQSFTKLLEKYDPELLFRFATPTVEPSNADKDRKTLMYLTNGIISINEQRISEGLEPIEGGDEPRIAGRPISEPAEEKPVEAKPEDEEPKEEEDSEDDNKEKSADPFFSGSRAKFWNENVKALDKGTKSLHKALKLFIDEYSKTINKGLKKQSAKILKTNHVWNPAKKDDDGKPIYFDIDDIVPEKQFLQDLYLYVVPMMEDVTTLGILAAEKLGKVDVTDYEFEQFTKSVMKESLEKIVTIHGTMKDDLTRQLLTGRINTQYEIFTAANKYYDDFGGWKAERIARTTSTQINNHSAYEVYKSHNIRRQWITERDKRVRPSHKKLDGTYADKNGNYEYVDESGKSQGKTKYPGGGEKAGEVINCRCIMRPRPK